MNRTFIRIVGIACCLSPLAAQAQTTKFSIRPIVIAGDDNVQATSINIKGDIVGTLYAGITDAPSGIEISGNTVTTLPVPPAPYTPLYPRQITDEGDILGWARGSLQGIALTFLLQRGVYNTNYQSLVLAPSSIAPDTVPLPMGLSNKREIFFNTIYGLSDPVGNSYGKPPHYRGIPEMNRFTWLQSINDSGTVAGTSFSFSGLRTMFTGKDKDFTAVLPPGSINTLGGFLNNAGAIAGSYEDSNRAYHGFVYQHGNYTTFDMPEAAGTVTVTAFNNNGRAAGSYTSASNGKVHAFLYNGTTVSSFGTYESTDTVSVALNDRGIMVVQRQIESQDPKYQSFRVTCAGSAC